MGEGVSHHGQAAAAGLADYSAARSGTWTPFLEDIIFLECARRIGEDTTHFLVYRIFLLLICFLVSHFLIVCIYALSRCINVEQ